MAARLDREPKVAQLARDLGLRGRGHWVSKLTDLVLDRVRGCIEQWPDVSSLDGLQLLLCEALSLKIEHVRDDSDLPRIGSSYRFPEALFRRLLREFQDEDTEGWLVHNPDPGPGDRRYIAIVDARGDRANRAYFTTWHEITHLILTPPQLVFDGFRRAIPVDKRKDPVESVVDMLAGRLAFYEPLVRPALASLLQRDRRLTLTGIESLRKSVAPSSSFYAAAIAVVQLVQRPVLLVQVNLALKKREAERLYGAQREFHLEGDAPIVPKLRVTAIPSPLASEGGLRIFSNMRVPEASVLRRAHSEAFVAELEAVEDQSWWETSSGGPLPRLPLRVSALRRGAFVYGLIEPLQENAIAVTARVG